MNVVKIKNLELHKIISIIHIKDLQLKLTRKGL